MKAKTPEPLGTINNEVLPAGVASFQRHLTAWQDRLGLSDWRIVLSSLRAKNAMAEMSKWDWKQRQVTCRIGLNWKATPVTEHSIEQTAVHELLHVMLYELIAYAKESSTKDDDLASIEHRVINTLERLLVPPKP
jgi:hypothetical protein